MTWNKFSTQKSCQAFQGNKHFQSWITHNILRCKWINKFWNNMWDLNSHPTILLTSRLTYAFLQADRFESIKAQIIEVFQGLYCGLVNNKRPYLREIKQKWLNSRGLFVSFSIFNTQLHFHNFPLLTFMPLIQNSRHNLLLPLIFF